MTRTLIPVALLAALVTAAASAQTFRAGTEAVRVDVLVTNDNRPVGGLTRADFELLDNGVPQSIEDVTIEEVPFSMLLALDASASMEGRPLDDLKKAADAAVGAMRSGDRASILTFSEGIARPADWQPGGPALLQAIAALQASRATALFDAAYAALSLRDRDPGRRALVVLFSDGDDTSSWLPASAPLDKARRTDAVVYTVALGERAMLARSPVVTPSRSQPGSRRLLHRSGVRLSAGAPLIEQSAFLPEIAERTGGEAFVAESTGRLREAFTRIVMDFRSRYLLSYVPKGVDTPGWHRIEVRTQAGRVRARPGYER